MIETAFLILQRKEEKYIILSCHLFMEPIITKLFGHVTGVLEVNTKLNVI